MPTPYDHNILLVNFRGFTTPGATPAETAQIIRQKAPNVAGIMLKTSNGIAWQGAIPGDVNPKAITGTAKIKEWVDAFAAQNLEVHVWGVPRAKRQPGQTLSSDLNAEAEKLVQAANVPGVKSLLIDVEIGNFYWLGTPDEARTLMSMVRSGVGADMHIGFITDGRRNRDFRWWIDPWMPFVDSLHPMIYPILFGKYQTVEKHLDESLNNLLGYSKPIIPMLQAFGEAGVRPTQAEVTQQGNSAFARGATGISFFRLGMDRWGFDGLPHMGNPEYAGIAAISVPQPAQPQLPVTYTWQDVINASVVVALRTGGKWQDWLEQSGFTRTFANTLRTQLYTGPAVAAWNIPPLARDQLIDLLKLDSAALALLTAETQSDAERRERETDAQSRLEGSSIIGIHGAPGAAAPPDSMWDTWIKLLKEMRVVWFKQVDWADATDSNDLIFRWAKRLKAEGIEPIIRYYVQGMFPGSLPAAAFNRMRAYAAAGITWAEIGNEPNLTVEWQEQFRAAFTVTDATIYANAAEVWIKDAKLALDAGAKPAFYAVAPTDWRGGTNQLFSGVLMIRNMIGHLARNHRAATIDIFRRGGWIAVHSATFEQPVDFDPFANGPEWEMTLRSYEIVLNEFKKAFGRDLDVDAIPVISTEGGVYTKDSTSMGGHNRLQSNEEHATRVVEMFRYLDRQKRLKAMTPWCLSVGSLIGHFDAQFAEDGWVREVNGQLAPLPVIEAMKQLSFDQQREEEAVAAKFQPKVEPAAEAGGSAPLVMQVRLDVAYTSQNDLNALTHSADCGPTCLVMIHNTGKAPVQWMTVDKLYQDSATLRNKQKKDLTFTHEMVSAARDIGLTMREEDMADDRNTALEKLRGYLRQGLLTIPLINYDKWMNIAQPGFEFRKGHFVVVTGFDADHVFVNDPIFPPRDHRGRNFVWTNENFLNGWGTARDIGAGPNFHLLVSDKSAALT